MVGPEFGNWLAGFTDGEGCFTVEAYRGRASHSCSFTIALRVDDKSILDECQLRTGLGIVTEKHSPSIVSRWPAQAHWRIRTKADCAGLAELFTVHPLRSKKRADFDIWRQAVIEWNVMDSYPRRNEDGRRLADWSFLALARENLMTGRAAPDLPY